MMLLENNLQAVRTIKVRYELRSDRLECVEVETDLTVKALVGAEVFKPPVHPDGKYNHPTDRYRHHVSQIMDWLGELGLDGGVVKETIAAEYCQAEITVVMAKHHQPKALPTAEEVPEG